MYKKDDGQITIAEFISPFGGLDKNNRWIRIADMIPWTKYEKKYAERFCENNGAPAVKFRMAMGSLIIKQKTGHSDDDVLQEITENPYMQYLIGLHEFTVEAPFSQSSLTNFRKYITKEMINEINEEMFRTQAGNDENDDRGSGGGNGNIEKPGSGAEPKPANKGSLLIDATCAPAYIAYPTDVNLLNEAREKLEVMIDTLHAHTGNKLKPRTYRKVARRKYLLFIKQRKPRKKAVRKAVGEQLRFVARDLGHIEKISQSVGVGMLSAGQRRRLETIKILYRQQRLMYETNTHSTDNRIVSISQPHVRPIVRGKTNAPVEFGAKVSISMVNGYAFTDKIGWEAYNEESLLIPTVESYRKQHGFYPEVVQADKIYRNRNNRAYCKKHGIRLSGPRLGRPPKETNPAVIKQERMDVSARNAVEGKFGEGKTKYGLDRIMARLQGSSETVIALSFFCMNISRRLRLLLFAVINIQKYAVLRLRFLKWAF